jgi:hypothetical protein
MKNTRRRLILDTFIFKYVKVVEYNYVLNDQDLLFKKVSLVILQMASAHKNLFLTGNYNSKQRNVFL